MKRIFRRYFPRFCTHYYVVLDDPCDDSSPLKLAMRIKGKAQCVPGFRYLRIRFFNCCGLMLFKKTEHLDLTH